MRLGLTDMEVMVGLLPQSRGGGEINGRGELVEEVESERWGEGGCGWGWVIPEHCKGSSLLPNVAHVLPRVDNASKDDDPKCGRHAAESREGRTGGRAGRGGGNVGANVGVDRVPEFSTIIAQQLQNLLPTILAQVGNHVNNLENIVDDNTQGDVRNVIVNNARRDCTYKEFLACNPKEYDGKGGVVVYTRWIENMESVQDMSGCGDNQKVKYTAGSFMGKALTWWNSEVHTRS
ncbi:hypothetical protein Tco_0786434 [Tanacetum coccineum]